MSRIRFLKQELTLFPGKKVALTLFLLFSSCFLIILRGSKEYASLIGLDYCGLGYWAMNFFQILLAIMFEYVLYKYLSRK